MQLFLLSWLPRGSKARAYRHFYLHLAFLCWAQIELWTCLSCMQAVLQNTPVYSAIMIMLATVRPHVWCTFNEHAVKNYCVTFMFIYYIWTIRNRLMLFYPLLWKQLYFIMTAVIIMLSILDVVKRIFNHPIISFDMMKYEIWYELYISDLVRLSKSARR